MPLILSKTKSPKGRDVAKMVSRGEVSPQDAADLMKEMTPGSPYMGLPILAVIEPGANYSPEARQIFTKSNQSAGDNRVAIVVSSAPMRVLLSFIIKATGSGSNTKFFGNEADALAFIDG